MGGLAAMILSKMWNDNITVFEGGCDRMKIFAGWHYYLVCIDNTLLQSILSMFIICSSERGSHFCLLQKWIWEQGTKFSMQKSLEICYRRFDIKSW